MECVGYKDNHHSLSPGVLNGGPRLQWCDADAGWNGLMGDDFLYIFPSQWLLNGRVWTMEVYKLYKSDSCSLSPWTKAEHLPAHHCMPCSCPRNSWETRLRPHTPNGLFSTWISSDPSTCLYFYSELGPSSALTLRSSHTWPTPGPPMSQTLPLTGYHHVLQPPGLMMNMSGRQIDGNVHPPAIPF